MRWVLLAVTVLVALVTSPAAACPPGRPCNKHYNHGPRMEHQDPDRYVHSIKGLPPAFEPRRVARFLLGGGWKPVYDKPLPKEPQAKSIDATEYIRETEKLRFVDPTKAIPEPRDGERIVLVRYVEKKKGTSLVLVDVDGAIYQLRACKQHKGYACLVPSDVGFDEVDPDHPVEPVFGPTPE
ncbi:MAG TPA: hypothetical protein VLB44_09980 [Kofleriaceae bacterium]|nr:hypothetical protein [Kofleriaceae bacterium]